MRDQTGPFGKKNLYIEPPDSEAKMDRVFFITQTAKSDAFSYIESLSLKNKPFAIPYSETDSTPFQIYTDNLRELNKIFSIQNLPILNIEEQKLYIDEFSKEVKKGSKIGIS